MHHIVYWIVYLALFVDRARALQHVLSRDHGARTPHEVADLAVASAGVVVPKAKVRVRVRARVRARVWARARARVRVRARARARARARVRARETTTPRRYRVAAWVASRVCLVTA